MAVMEWQTLFLQSNKSAWCTLAEFGQQCKASKRPWFAVLRTDVHSKRALTQTCIERSSSGAWGAWGAVVSDAPRGAFMVTVITSVSKRRLD